MRIRQGFTKFGVLASLGLLTGGGVAGAVTTAIVTDDPATVNATATGATMTPSAREAFESDDGPLECSLYDVPSLEAPVIPRSTLSEGAPYVIVCNNPTGLEVLNAVFIHRIRLQPPA